MEIHIGKLIEDRLKLVGQTKSEFARRIHKARQNVNDILTRRSIDTDLLFSISLALKYDFFQHYVTALSREEKITEPSSEFNRLKEQEGGFEKRNSEIMMELAVARRTVELQKTTIDLYKRLLGDKDEAEGKPV